MNNLCNKTLAERFYYWRHMTEEARRQQGLMNKYMLKLVNHFQIGAFSKWKDFCHAERRAENAKRRKELEMELK